MAKSFSYNTSIYSFYRIFRATSGGTVFSSDLHGTANFDYFDDSPTVNDAIYFYIGNYNAKISDLLVNVGTAMAGTDIVLKIEYYKKNDGWVEVEDLQDDTNGLTILGANRIRFPSQWQPHTVDVNGYKYGGWVRIRLDSFTTVTEGGSNTTDTIKTSNGMITLYGGTDTDPHTMQGVYDYLKTYYPYISISKRNESSFDFTKVGINCYTRTVSNNEVIELGQDCQANMAVSPTYLSYFQSGYKKDDTTAYGGSTIIVHGRNNSTVIDCPPGKDAKLYGVTIRTGKSNSDTYAFAGYFNLNGEHIDCNYELSVRPASDSSSVVSNVRMVGSLLLLNVLAGIFEYVKYLCVGYYFLYIYDRSITFPNFTYQFKNSTGCLAYIYRSSTRKQLIWKLRNPSIQTGLLTDPITPAKISVKNSYMTIEAVKIYDDSSGTYTDYTAEAQSSTASDVPLSGDVDDYILFGFTNRGNAYSTSLEIELPTQTNDYVYEWEYWDNGAWNAVEDPSANYMWDETENFIKSGGIFMATPIDMDAVTIDGVNSYWIRARITTKGTDSPMASLIRQHRHTGVSDWQLISDYPVNLTIVDEQNNPIENATVIALDENGDELFSVTTDINGQITTQYVVDNKIYFDPINNPTDHLGQDIYSTFDLKIKRSGYRTIKMNGLATGRPINLKLQLTRSKIIIDQEVF